MLKYFIIFKVIQENILLESFRPRSTHLRVAQHVL